MAKKKNYEAAFTEAQQILTEIETEEIDVDTLTVKVKKAAELLKICKEKLHQTEKDVEDILESLAK